MKNQILLSLASCLILFGCDNNVEVKESTTVIINEQSQPAVDTTTMLRIVNETDDSVIVWVTLGATAGCLQDISQVPFVTDSVAPLKGYFTLYAHDSTPDFAPVLGTGFNGAISFNTPALNCPTQQFPEGVNIFEFILNVSYQAGIPQESVEISCVAGVNCLLQGIFTGGIDWNASSMYPNVDTIYNRGKYNNSGLIGVFPYGCDDCTASVAPPACAKSDKDKQKYPICIVQRNAKGSGGGLVRASYKGGAPQPAMKKK